jgi:chromosome partitioning protein
VAVISIVSSKGGVGKTTLTSALAVAAASEGKRVALVDLDPQGSLAAWHARRKDSGLTIVTDADKASDAVEDLGDEFDYIFIDTPPAFIATIEDAIEACDAAIIPLRPSALDIIASEDAVIMAREAGKPHLCVLNDAEPRWKTTAGAGAYLKAGKVHLAKDPVTHRAAYLGAMTSGKTGPEIDRTGTAGDEIAALWKEVKGLLAAAKKGKARG